MVIKQGRSGRVVHVRCISHNHQPKHATWYTRTRVKIYTRPFTMFQNTLRHIPEHASPHTQTPFTMFQNTLPHIPKYPSPYTKTGFTIYPVAICTHNSLGVRLVELPISGLIIFSKRMGDTVIKKFYTLLIDSFC